MKLFKNKRKNKSTTSFKLITQDSNGFFNWDGKTYKSDIIRSCIRPKTKAIGKLVPKHIRENVEGFKVNPTGFGYIKNLFDEPNPNMSFQMLLEKTINQLQLNNNAFIYIVKECGYPIGLYPVNAYGIEALYDKSNKLMLRCTLSNGNTLTDYYENFIHIREDFNNNDIFGDDVSDILKPLMEIVNTTDQGIVNAIKNSNMIKWLLKFNQSLRKEDVEKATKDFSESFLSIDSKFGGAAAVDSKMDAIQVKDNNYVPNALQTKETIQRIYSFFNVNDKIIQSKYNEDEWNAYYESEIEPLAIQLSNEFTKKLFSKKERSFGNKIIFESANLQYASLSTKMNLVQMIDRGALTPNEWRVILGLAPIEGGDKPIRRLDTAVVEESLEGGGLDV